jgi:hypothetical protein
MLEDDKISAELKRITHSGDRSRQTVMSGKVLSVDEATMVAMVVLTTDSSSDGSADDDSTPVPCQLNVIDENSDGFYLVPAEKADCEVAEIDGPGKWSIVRASKYTKISGKIGGQSFSMTSDGFVFNGGSKGGVPQINELKDNLEALRDYIKNTLEPAIKSTINAIGVGSGSNAPAAVISTWTPAVAAKDIFFEDMEDKKVKH